MADITSVSPLAPVGGFPELPVIDGVRFSAAAAGVRYSERLDVMLAEIAAGSSVAGTFTRSSTRSAPVLWCEEILSQPQLGEGESEGYAVVVNSGNANAFTGKAGRGAVDLTVETAAGVLGIPAKHVFVASTGVIGEPLPADRIATAMKGLHETLRADDISLAAKAIMTTDTFAKGSGRSLDLGGATVSISGIAKGSGMIAPDMATMLVFIFTDARISPDLLQEMVSRATGPTFNSITVDGDTSTSDSLLVVATNRSDMASLSDVRDPHAVAFEQALTDVMRDLAHLVVRDGEGATKFVEVHVSGAASTEAARTVGLSIANSPLVKTAIAGEDPNWGRVVMAVGKSGEEADRDLLSISFGDIVVAENGWVSESYEESEGAAYMKRDDIRISADLGIGDGAATVWTCDLTHGYININADYRS